MPASVTRDRLIQQGLADIRKAIRAGAYDGHTAGLALGRLQCNVVILPKAFADDFKRYCLRNPKPCPVVYIGEAGEPGLRGLGDGIDIRTDVPKYFIYEAGVLSSSTKDISELWQEDFVTFAIGCSFTFEAALIAAGYRLKHVEANLTVPMFRTNLMTQEAGRFHGPMVVSMRAFPRHQMEDVVAVTEKFPHAHGGPVHVGDPSVIGIEDLGNPNWGDPTELGTDDVPAFWACGVTPQVAIENARPPICITHAPGRMLICDKPDVADYAGTVDDHFLS